MPDDLSHLAADAAVERFMEGWRNYNALLESMSPEELATEVGRRFRDPYQAALVMRLLCRITRLEHGQNPNQP